MFTLVVTLNSCFNPVQTFQFQLQWPFQHCNSGKSLIQDIMCVAAQCSGWEDSPQWIKPWWTCMGLFLLHAMIVLKCVPSYVLGGSCRYGNIIAAMK